MHVKYLEISILLREEIIYLGIRIVELVNKLTWDGDTYIPILTYMKQMVLWWIIICSIDILIYIKYTNETKQCW